MARRKTRRPRHLSAEHRKAISEGVKRYWRRQHEIDIPRGFKTGKAEIEPILNRAMRVMIRDHGVDGDIRREVNADKTVDWELRFAIPRGVNLVGFTTDLGTVLKPAINAWIAIGARFTGDKKMDRETREAYERFRALYQVHAHYQRMTGRKIATNIVAIQQIIASMRKHKRRKPVQIFVRVHWNLTGDKPS